LAIWEKIGLNNRNGKGIERVQLLGALKCHHDFIITERRHQKNTLKEYREHRSLEKVFLSFEEKPCSLNTLKEKQKKTRGERAATC